MGDHVEGTGRKTRAQHKQLAGLIKGPVAKRKMKISEALVQCGYSETQSRRGWDTVPAKVREMVGKKKCTMLEKGRKIASSPELARDLVLGRLATNVEAGKDGGTASAKVLGSWKPLTMWQPDIQNGVIVLSMPPGFAALRDSLNDPEYDSEPAKPLGPGEYTAGADGKLVKVR